MRVTVTHVLVSFLGLVRNLLPGRRKPQNMCYTVRVPWTVARDLRDLQSIEWHGTVCQARVTRTALRGLEPNSPTHA